MNKKPTWTILLIDAQPMSRNTLKSQLEYYQYAVLLADSARTSPSVCSRSMARHVSRS